MVEVGQFIIQVRTTTIAYRTQRGGHHITTSLHGILHTTRERDPPAHTTGR